ncbi:hypothetical protein MTR67_010961 [Solanum verrucosum]|uniref:Uncharacterized protein n=1 Tax=Solanum verrucosum TaxID=315347 RepID=A0AAF0QBR6_SOLVR|nr:hypothetical protein MTR67_010961 [Solanum verrucosum]
MAATQNKDVHVHFFPAGVELEHTYWCLGTYCPDYGNTTSKYRHSDDMHAFFVSFGLKGEALSSTSDVSLLEIVTKTHARPNGYRKVLKVKFF